MNWTYGANWVDLIAILIFTGAVFKLMSNGRPYDRHDALDPRATQSSIVIMTVMVAVMVLISAMAMFRDGLMVWVRILRWVP